MLGDIPKAMAKLLGIISIDDELFQLHIDMFHYKNGDFNIREARRKELTQKRGNIKNSLHADLKRMESYLKPLTRASNPSFESLEESIIRLWKSRGMTVEIMKFRVGKNGKGMWTVIAKPIVDVKNEKRIS